LLKNSSFRSENEEAELMKAVVPHLRLLTLPIDKLGPISNYLSDTQIAYLAKIVMHKDERSAGSVSPGLNLSRVPRRRPKNQKLKLEFIAEDLIKNDWQMMCSLERKKNDLERGLQIFFVAKQHLFLKGIEILTKANNNPKFECVSSNKKASRY